MACFVNCGCLHPTNQQPIDPVDPQPQSYGLAKRKVLLAGPMGIMVSGQSNGGSSDSVAGEGIENPKVTLKVNSTAAGQPTTTNDKLYYGTQVADILAKDNNQEVNVTVSFKSGEPVGSWFDKDGNSGVEWDNLVARGQASFDETGVPTSLFIWSHGPADANKGGNGTPESNHNDYYVAVQNLFAAVRAEPWTADDLLIVVVEPKRGGAGAFPTDDRRDAIYNFGFDHPYTAVVSTADLTDPVDSLHYQGYEIEEIGNRIHGMLDQFPYPAFTSQAQRFNPVGVPLTFFGGAGAIDGTTSDAFERLGIEVEVNFVSEGVYDVVANRPILSLIVNQSIVGQNQRRQAKTAPHATNKFIWQVQTFDSTDATEIEAPENAVLNGMVFLEC